MYSEGIWGPCGWQHGGVLTMSLCGTRFQVVPRNESKREWVMVQWLADCVQWLLSGK